MKGFNYFNPVSMDEALKLIEAKDESTYLIAGGTDLVLELNEKKIHPERVINLKGIKELSFIREDDGFIRIGAGTTFTEISNSELLQECAVAFVQACSKVGSTQIRNLGTVGGNVVTGSACADSVSALTAFDAVAVLKSSRGSREVLVADFFTPREIEDNCAGCKKSIAGIEKDEILFEVYFKKGGNREFSAFRKLGKRRALAKSIMTVGMVVKLGEDEVVERCSLALGAVGSHPYRVESAENILVGKKLDNKTIESCLEEVSDIVVQNIGSRASCPFKKESVKGIVREVITSIKTQSIQ
ncbi:carbon-monoxide dehydrogenase medium subunit [Dethiosulfatibacter aminovorans DSM 17477]|uniref:Carbon-monoxide dehydrogenase medium subunit n=1 Tax=Dethiosulfatibacter aminovorans DSM 17477 TaxID=1121476 RepID=A0A1M6A6J5_9FIRM|nr:FAD binding domain-containing protein [Dethiosulfatibacter aminovorans]SHI32111.1 carbon-monoxide dehydrogenase medium subunit [Dethiosulfatibacter aminovorans DSM 17477]